MIVIGEVVTLRDRIRWFDWEKVYKILLN
jgi:hypothetical protein